MPSLLIPPEHVLREVFEQHTPETAREVRQCGADDMVQMVHNVAEQGGFENSCCTAPSSATLPVRET